MISILDIVDGMRSVASPAEIQQTDCSLYCPQRRLIHAVAGAQMPALVLRVKYCRKEEYLWREIRITKTISR